MEMDGGAPFGSISNNQISGRRDTREAAEDHPIPAHGSDLQTFPNAKQMLWVWIHT